MSSSSAEPNLDDVVSLFKDHTGDESGGLHAIRGFSFQVWQAVVEALKAHASGKDYAVVLEWQQDIAILDSSTRPSRITFLQVKKNESSHHWTIHALLSVTSTETTAGAKAPIDQAAPAAVRRLRRSAGPSSVLAKLYFHRRRFTAIAPTRLIFTSNAPFYVGIDDHVLETLSTVRIGELPAAPLQKVHTALRRQLVIPTDEVLDLSEFELEVTNCPIENAHKYAIGELVEQCALHKIEPLVSAPFVAVCLMASYIQQRAGKASFAKDFNALLARAITRADVTSYFAAANDSHVTTQDLVEQVIARLNLEVADFEMVQSMQEQLNLACAEITNRTSVLWGSLNVLARMYIENDNYKKQGGLKHRFPQWLTDFRAAKVQNAQLFNDGYLYCLMAMIIKNARPVQHLSAAAADSQLKAKE